MHPANRKRSNSLRPINSFVKLAVKAIGVAAAMIVVHALDDICVNIDA
jgi:hypothetical protein